MGVCAALLMSYWSYWLHDFLLPSNPKYLLRIICCCRDCGHCTARALNGFSLIMQWSLYTYQEGFFSFAKRKQFSNLAMWLSRITKYMGFQLMISPFLWKFMFPMLLFLQKILVACISIWKKNVLYNKIFSNCLFSQAWAKPLSILKNSWAHRWVM